MHRSFRSGACLASTAIVAGVLLGACGGGASNAPSATGAASAGASRSGPASSPSPSGLASATASSATASAAPASATATSAPASPAPGDPSAVRVDMQPVVDGLAAPLYVTGPADRSNRLFVVEQAGRIRIVRDGRIVDPPFLDIADRVSSGGERGLLGLAFPKDFGRGRSDFFVNYTDRDGNTAISSFTVRAGDPDVADPSSERVLLHVAQPYPNHNGGMLAFGTDRMLYAGLGDGGSGGDPHGNGQRLDTLLGKLLRIDVSGSPTSGRYAVPPDNPFVGRANARPEIWSYGLRNPWRFGFDRATSDLWIGDVGQGAWEEIDLARAHDGGGRGLDFGWNRMEGTHCYPPGASCDRSGLTLPVAEYGHDQGCAVVGGYVDRAPDAGPLAGVYLFSDNCSGRIWGLSSAKDGPQTPVVLNDGGRAISSFGEAADGTVYATDLSGGVLLRVVGNPR